MKLRYLKNVVTLKLDSEKCIGCGMCVEVCPHEVFKFENKKAIVADADACIECGACQSNCPVGAVLVEQGVGCAQAIVRGLIKGGKPSCDCS